MDLTRLGFTERSRCQCEHHVLRHKLSERIENGPQAAAPCCEPECQCKDVHVLPTTLGLFQGGAPR